MIPPIILVVAFLIIYVTAFPEGKSTPVYVIPSPFSSAHSIFLSVSSLIVAYFFARSFLSAGSLNLLVLGSGSLILGSGFLLSQVLGNPPFGGPIQQAGISDPVFLSSGILFGGFALINFAGKDVKIRKPAFPLSLSYAFCLMVVVVVIWTAESGLAPAFFVPGVGPTLLHRELRVITIILFFFSFLAVIRSYVASRSPILYWFAFGLELVAFGFVGALPASLAAGPFSWMGRISFAIAGVYFLEAVLAAYRGTEAKTSESRGLGQS